MCVSSSWDSWKTSEISFSLTAVPTLQPVFMYLNRGGMPDFGNRVQSVLIPAIFWGFTFPKSQIPQKNTQNTHKNKNANLPLRYVVPLRALSLKLTLGPISEGGTRIAGAKRARIDGEAQEKAGEPLARKLLRI